MIQRKSLVFLSSVLLVVLLNISSARATDYWINPSSTQSSTDCGSSEAEACPHIGDILNLSHLNSGDIIHLCAGTYTGPLNVGLTVNVAGIQILGDPKEDVIIDLNGSPTFLTIQASGVVVSYVTIQGAITGSVDVGVINVQLTVGVNVNALLDAIKFNNVNFLNIQGTAILCADLNALNGKVDVKVNANIFVNVVLSVCSFVNVTVSPVLVVVGRISLRLNSVTFDGCGSAGLAGAVVLAQKQCAVVLVAVTIKNCKGSTLLDLTGAATLTLNQVLTLDANVVDKSLCDLNLNLDINILGLSVRLDANTAPVACTNVKCGLVNLNSLCTNCPLVNLDLGSFF